MTPSLAMWHSPHPQRLSFEGRNNGTLWCAQNGPQQYGSISDLPPLLLQHIISLLDPASRLELRKVNQLCRHAVDCAWKLVCMPLDQIKHHGLNGSLAQFPSAGCLVISAPQQPVSLSILGRRRRCEQILSVLLDNTNQQPSCLSALDLSHSISSVTSAVIQLLVEALPALQHLALPAVAGIGSSGQWEVFRLLGQLAQLESCELDCTYFAVACSSGHTQQQHGTNAGRSSRSAAHEQQPPVQLQTQHPQRCTPAASDSKIEHSCAVKASAAHTFANGTRSCSNSRHAFDDPLPGQFRQLTLSDVQAPAADSCSSFEAIPAFIDSKATNLINTEQRTENPVLHICPLLPLQPQPCRPWGNLCNLSQLQQLQLSHPCELQELFENLKSLTRLRHLGLVRVQRGYSSALLDPGVAAAASGVCEQGIGQLSCLQSLTRLELGLDQHCGCMNAGMNTPASMQPMRLITPPHLSINATPAATTPPTPAAPAALSPARTPAHNSPVSSPNPAGTCAFTYYSCCWSHLTQLRVLLLSGGICLDMPLLAATADCSHLTELRASALLLESDAPLGFRGLQELRVLAVTQRFCLGGHSAAALFPRLQKLSIKDDGNYCPDLSCLKYHSSLASLAVEAPASGWQLSSLQLGYLVHLDTLRQLSLASKCCTGGGHATGGSSVSHSPISALAGLKSPGALRSMSGSLQPCNSSHWLPAATLTQVTSLTLAGPSNDHTLSQLPSQFPGLVTLQLLGSYYASDWGLKRLCRAPHLATLLLEGCEHVTEYGLEVLLRGGSIKVLAVHGCGGVDERACHRIRRACRHSCTNLSWHGTDGLQHLHHLQHHHGRNTSGSSSSVNSSSAASGWGTSSIASADSHHDLSFFDTDGQHCNFGSSNEASDSSVAAGDRRSAGSNQAVVSQWGSGSEFLERCWRESLQHQASSALAKAPASRGGDLVAEGGDECCAPLQSRIAENREDNSNKSNYHSNATIALVSNSCPLAADSVKQHQQRAAAIHAAASAATAASWPFEADTQPHSDTFDLDSKRTDAEFSRTSPLAAARVAIARVASAPVATASISSRVSAGSKDLYGRKIIYMNSSSTGASAASSCSYGGGSNSSSCAGPGTQHSSLTGFAR